MLWLALVSSFSVILISCFVAAISYYFDLRSEPLNNASQAYLFSRNSEILAAASNVGTSLSLTLFLGAIVPGVAGYGLLPILGSYLGVIVGTLLLIRTGRRVSIAPDSTMIGLVSEDASHLFRLVQMVLYTSSIILELVIAEHLATALVGGHRPAGLLVIAIIVFLCATYTSLGGFIGILRTDAFQLLVIIAGLAAALVDSSIKIPALRSTVRYQYLAIDSPALLAASISVVFAYFFASPDIWLRSFGTLGGSNRSSTRALVKSLGLTLLVLTAPILLGLSWLVSTGHLSNTLSMFDAVGYVAGLLSSAMHGGAGATTVWFVAGAITCALVTTLDTQFLAIAQHVRAASEKPLVDLRFLVLTTALTTLVVSLTIGPNAWICAGLLVFGGLLANTVVLLFAAKEKPLRLSRAQLLYFVRADALLLVGGAALLWRVLDRYFHWLILGQVVLAVVWCVVLRAKGEGTRA